MWMPPSQISLENTQYVRWIFQRWPSSKDDNFGIIIIHQVLETVCEYEETSGSKTLYTVNVNMQFEIVSDWCKERVLGSNSSWASPIVLITKWDCFTRFCIDFRSLSDITTKDAYPFLGIY